MMRLYHSPTTPFGRKVMVLILETGLEGDIEIVSASGSPLDPAIGTNYLFSRASGRLFAIDAGYWLLFYAAMGAVFVILG